MDKLLKISALFALCFVWSSSALLAADPSRDPFYTALSSRSAPEMNTVSENVDPFSGILTLTHTDLHLPGNGGLDVNVMRTYNSMIWGRRDTSFPGLIALNERSPVGIGWSMHMGIVRNPYGTGSSNRYLPDNPVVEMPDGSMHTLFKDKNDSTRFISRDFWLYKSVGTGKWELTLTDGTVYTFEYGTGNAGYYTMDSVQIAQVTSIRNAAGTATINIDYYQHSNGYSYLETITDSCNRNVTFNYDYTNNRLTSITVDTRTFSYSYTTTNGQNYLTIFTPPVGNSWTYTYEPSGYELSAINFPTGGNISYTYNDISFHTGQVYVEFRVIAGRSTSGRDITTGSWTYQYSSGSSSGDTTTITGPSVTETHKFYGWGNAGTGNVWKVGLPMSKDYNFNGSTLSESYAWTQGTQVSYDEISNADWSGTIGWVYDSNIYIPFMSSQTITRDGKSYSTSYSSFNTYGDPQSISETGDQNRTTSVSYWTNTSKNIVKGKPSSRTVTGDFSGTSSTSWTYETNSGNVLTNTVDGVLTTYTYDSNGNLDTAKDANNKTTSYNWSYGRISSETNPEYTGSSSINSNGTVASETNGRGYTTYYTYDKNLRLTNIDPPTGNSISFSYPSDSSYKRQTRDGYSIDHLYDGFGRPGGSEDSKGVTTTISYNAYGAKDYTDLNIGDKIYHDYFGRVKQVVHKDNNDITYSYSYSNVTATDENNGTVTLTYNAFGNPAEKYLVSVKDQANNTTSYTRNIQGNITAITQGSLSRTFTYDSTKKNFLVSESNPESGTISYSRDNVGNMTGKTDSTGTKTYTYDGINRLTGITSGSYSISFSYDDANNRTSMNSPDASISYTYDSANRLTQKSETIGGRAYTITYGYDSNDNITSISYPSGRTATYGYNSDNEVTSITGFGESVTSVSYNTAGLPTSYTYSNGLTSSISYNTRNLATSLSAGSAVDVDYGYDSRSNTTSYINYLDRSKDQSFGYDSLSRLTGFNGAWGTGSFSYTTYGNRDGKTVAGTSTLYSYSNNKLSVATGGEPASYSYNGNGALSSGTWQGVSYTLEYDKFDNVKTYKSGTTILAEFGYDGDGMRVIKTSDTKTTVYHYDQGGRVISEDEGNGNLIADYVYLNGKLVAKVAAMPEISVTPTSESFGNVYVNTSSSKHTFTISNEGSTDLVLETISVTGSNSSEFVKVTDACTGQTLVLSESCIIQVKLSPTSVGSKSANLSIPSNDPDTPTFTASLSGVGILPTLTVSKSGTGSGTVTSSISGINCGTDCTEAYNTGTSVTLTATPDSTSNFAGWSGACSGTGSCTVTMNSDTSVTASFDLPTLTVSKTGIGTGTVTSSPSGISCGSDCTQDYNKGTSVTLTATADSAWDFIKWTGSCSGSQTTCSFTMSTDTTATPEFGCLSPPVRIPGKGSYSSLQAAYNAAAPGDTIQSRAVTLTESVNAYRDILVTIDGGFNCHWTTNSGGTTTLNGQLTLNSGKVTVKNFILQ